VSGSVRGDMTELEARELLAMLPEREAMVLRDRFWHKKTLRCIGKSLGVSGTRADQICKKAAQRLRAFMEPKSLLTSELIEAAARRRRLEKLQKLKELTSNLESAMRAKYPELFKNL
jgi:phosphoglycerate dehydrogenase-like enzyme